MESVVQRTTEAGAQTGREHAPLKVLIVEDSADDAELMLHELRRVGLDPYGRRVEREADFVEGLRAEPDLVIADFRLPNFDAMRALDVAQELAPDVPFILVSGSVSEDVALEMMRRGAIDYLFKDRLSRLGPAVQRALQERQLRKQKAAAEVAAERAKEAADQAEEAVVRTEERWESLVLNSSDIIAVIDEHGCLEYASPAAERILGLSLTSRVGQDVSALVHPDDIELLRSALAAGAAAPGVGNTATRWRIRHADGSLRTVESVANNLLDDPAVRGIVVNVRDVTAQVDAEAAQARSEARLQTVVDHAPVTLFTFDPHGVFTLVEGQGFGRVGLGPADLVGRSVFDILEDLAEAAGLALLGDDADVVLQALDTVFDVRLRPLRDQGSIVGGLGVATDITERVRAEQAVLHREALLREAERIAHVGHWEWDLADGLVDLHAEEMFDILGTTPEAWKGTADALFDIVLPEDRGRLLAAMDEARAEGHVAVEYRIMRPDGSVRWLRQRSEVSFDERGEAVRLAATAQDVTDAKLADAELANLNRVLRTLSIGNETLMKVTDEEHLLGEMCRVVVEEGAYPVAGVAVAEPLRDGVRVRASCGPASPLTEALALCQLGGTDTACALHDMLTGQGPTIADVATLPESLPCRRVALELGVRSLAGLPLRVDGDVFGALVIGSERAGAFDPDTVKVLDELAHDLGFGIATLRTRAERQRYFEELERSFEAAVGAVATTIELRDPYTAGHQRRVAELSVAMAGELGLDPDGTKGIAVAATIHDIGKIGIPAEILAKPTTLAPAEHELVKGHAQAGHDIVAGVDFPWPIATMILQHHERLDGSGYPEGLRGDEIVLGARVIAVADVVEAMSSHRPYRPALGIGAALAEIDQQRDTLFDPAVVEACLRLFGHGRFRFTV